MVRHGLIKLRVGKKQVVRSSKLTVEPLETRSLMTTSPITWSTTNLHMHDGVLAIPNTTAYVNPAGFEVKLHANPPGGHFRNLTWTITGNNFTKDEYGASPTLRLPEGNYKATLSVPVSRQVGTRTYTTDLNIHDLVIVSMGDSYASGEGNPVKRASNIYATKWAYSPDKAMAVENAAAHRSPYAASAVMAMTYQREHPHVAVTYVSVAITGATIPDGMLNPTTRIKNSLAEGQREIKKQFVSIPAEVDEAKSILGNHPVGLLTLSIGGNDMGFAGIIKKLFADVNGVLFGNILSNLKESAAAMPNRFAALGSAIQSKLGVTPARTLITEYPDISRDGKGEFSGAIGSDLSFSRHLNIGFLTINPFEARFASETILPVINSVVKAGANQNGWSNVGGIAAAFRTHGYPAHDTWIRRMNQSYDEQGDVNGSFHPNEAGHRAIAARLLASLPADLKST